jgi:hypothetical protein
LSVEQGFYVMQGDFYLTGDPAQSGVHEAVVDKMGVQRVGSLSKEPHLPCCRIIFPS